MVSMVCASASYVSAPLGRSSSTVAAEIVRRYPLRRPLDARELYDRRASRSRPRSGAALRLSIRCRRSPAPTTSQCSRHLERRHNAHRQIGSRGHGCYLSVRPAQLLSSTSILNAASAALGGSVQLLDAKTISKMNSRQLHELMGTRAMLEAGSVRDWLVGDARRADEPSKNISELCSRLLAQLRCLSSESWCRSRRCIRSMTRLVAFG
jgi:hypothetical protein